ncbi:MAG: DNA repair protein RadC [Betaproteobacteria bacterium]|nr:DNA repair protein RadC [Betaproteobacteria bacterium]
MPIHDWPTGERPREKLLQRGTQALSDAELLAIILRTGLPGKNALDLGRELLGHFGSLTRLFAASQTEFCAIAGLGEARYTQLQAMQELSRRALAEPLRERDALTSPAQVRNYLRLLLGGREHEVFCVIFLDSQHRVLVMEELFRGTLGQASVYPREVVKRALAHNAAALILAHNHPSGAATPSQADRALTDTLKQALALVDVRVLDHFVVAMHDVTSFAEHGWL